MNKEQQDLLNDAYKKYQTETMFRTDDLISLKELDGMDMSTGEIKKVYRQYAPVEFINKCKTDDEFSERWGLKIEERELSLKERYNIALPIWKVQYGPLADMMVPTNVDNTPFKIPTKLITVTYKDKTAESYE